MLACEHDSEAFSCWGDIPPQKKQKRFHQKAKKANEELRWMVAEATQRQRTKRAMWEESKVVLLFARIKP
ncbi:hypothetical protein EPR50_G00168470 [Perca flavescens]|uniref:Uncharacterized protein n=1 Tax=Perca flavescens TaxID=8167 RepID=A0A484CDQ9_PERFV|nr:hypothetical protein EPR50_G00168470 [Perca flavescens]